MDDRHAPAARPSTRAGPWTRISDPAVAYDPLHNVWMISTLAIDDSVVGRGDPDEPLDRRRPHLGRPVTTSTLERLLLRQELDHVRHVAAEPALRQLLPGVGRLRGYMSTSTDGGLTWGAAEDPGRSAGSAASRSCSRTAPSSSRTRAARASARSARPTVATRGCASVAVAQVSEHGVAGNLRTSPLPSAEVAGDGKVYVAWQDCGFRTGCTSNDIVYSTSMDGVAWTAKARVPIDPTNSGVDHFIPGFAVDRSTSGEHARASRSATTTTRSPTAAATCQLTVGFISSTDGGATWTQPRKVGGPISLSWIASTNQGVMVGDYMSTSFAGGNFAFPVFAVAKAARRAHASTSGRTARGSTSTLPSSEPLVRARKDPIRYADTTSCPISSSHRSRSSRS